MQYLYHMISEYLIGDTTGYSVYVMLPVWLYLLVAVALSLAVPRR